MALRCTVTLEAILVTALLLAHLAEPSQLLQAFRLSECVHVCRLCQRVAVTVCDIELSVFALDVRLGIVSYLDAI